MSKPIKYTVAIILKNNQDTEEFLLVKRPKEDQDLGGHWGFPAVTMNPGELPEGAARRICKEKLACEATPTRFVGIMFQKRNDYDIFLMDIEMVLTGDKQPDVSQARTTGTAYTDQRWTANPMDLMPSAKAGSCCSSIFLTDRGLLNREDWIASLESVDIVG